MSPGSTTAAPQVRSGASPLLLRSGAILLGTLVLAVSARIELPFWPVPMTMQTLAVLLIGYFYGTRLGIATLLAYLVEGTAGLPVFAGGAAGTAVFAGPTGGYLIGFAAAAALVGYGAERGWMRRLTGTVLVMSAAHALVFVFGVAWLALLIGAGKAITLGLTPFLAATAAKTALAVALARACGCLRLRPGAAG